ncbi:MAG TPA: adenylate/guanylate cyclase domain-containing protein, partial [Nannocystis exedens]|nr:adenylate/guanylate cyclase domain-containing protein [Nannocystis exedens]
MAPRSAPRIVPIGLALALILAVLTAYHRLGERLQPIENVERLTLDLRFRLRGPMPAGDAITIVAIDDATLLRYPRLLERRAAFAGLIDAVAAAKPAVIGVDAVLADRELLLGEELETAIRKQVAATPRAVDPASLLLRRVAAEIDGDLRLDRSIRAAGNVVLGFTIGARGEPLREDPALRKGRYDQSMLGARPPPSASLGLISLPEFNAAARALGMITVTVDRDQTARELIFARRYRDAVYAPLAVPLLAAYENAPPGSLAYLGGERKIRIGSREVELGDDDRMILNFRGPAATFTTLSAADVIDGNTGQALASKIVLIGITYLGHDRTRIPFGSLFPAIELHATAIDNMIAGDSIRRSSPLTDSALCALLGLLASLLFLRRFDAWPALRFAGLALLAGGHIAATLVAFAAYDLWVGLVWPLASVVIIGSVGLAAAYAGEAQQRRWLRRSFGQYLGGETLDQLLADPGGLALGGARQELSVLFSDIRDFTSISETLSPEELVELLNRFLTPMSEAVLSRGGYLDKYIGDAVMAVYGAPVR